MNIKKTNVVAIIPARSGSKSVVDKNIRLINNKPMIAYSIEQALKSESISRVIVSTDSEKYRDIAVSFGAECPFLRPFEFSQDDSLDIDVFRHAYSWLKDNENFEAEIFVHLRPTHPIRDTNDIDRMVEILLDNKDADSIRSISLAKDTPYKMWFWNQGLLSPVIDDIKEAYNMPRQKLPKVYNQNACIDVIRTNTIMVKNSMTGDVTLGYEMPFNFDIDTEEDFLRAELYLNIIQNPLGRSFTIVCDIDGIIAEKTIDNDYSIAKPNIKNIEIINRLFEQGNQIILFTARGYVTGIDWRIVTENQLHKWGVKFSSLKFGKPNADFYIDDKFITLYDLKKLIL